VKEKKDKEAGNAAFTLGLSSMMREKKKGRKGEISSFLHVYGRGGEKKGGGERTHADFGSSLPRLEERGSPKGRSLLSLHHKEKRIA